MTFHFLTPVWGKEYTRRYINLMLPAQLAALSKITTDSIYKIITDDQHEIMTCAAYHNLLKIMPVKIIALHNGDYKYQKMAYAYEQGSKCGDFKMGDSYIFLTPDSIWSDNSFVALETIAAKGYRAVMTVGPRLSMEPFISDFLQTVNSDLSIDSRTLSALTIKHFHRSNRCYIVGEKYHAKNPAAIYWRGKNALITRHFVFHPLLLTPNEEQLNIEYSIDYNLIPNNVLNKDVYVVTDSDELLGIDLTTVSYGNDQIERGTIRAKHIATWFSMGWATDFHKWLGNFTVYIHSTPLSKRTLKLDSKAEEFINSVNEKIIFDKKLNKIFGPLSSPRKVVNSIRGFLQIRTRIFRFINYLHGVFASIKNS